MLRSLSGLLILAVLAACAPDASEPMPTLMELPTETPITPATVEDPTPTPEQLAPDRAAMGAVTQAPTSTPEQLAPDRAAMGAVTQAPTSTQPPDEPTRTPRGTPSVPDGVSLASIAPDGVQVTLTGTLQTLDPGLNAEGETVTLAPDGQIVIAIDGIDPDANRPPGLIEVALLLPETLQAGTYDMGYGAGAGTPYAIGVQPPANSDVALADAAISGEITVSLDDTNATLTFIFTLTGSDVQIEGEGQIVAQAG